MDIVNQVSRRRLADDLWELVNVPSPTRCERNAALRFAEILRDCGAAVEVDETLPESPAVIGRLRGGRPGRTLQLAGHIDHIDVPHPPPKREENIISGRGAVDMKNGLAGMLEITRLLRQAGDFPGELLITAYGRHEAPLGDGHCLQNLLHRGIKGDAAIVLEGPDEAVVVTALGMGIWNLSLRREGLICHEMTGEEKGWRLLRALENLMALLDAKSQGLVLTQDHYPLLRPESLFVGQAHYGDFYNRVPTAAKLQGTRRWRPDKAFPQIQEEFAAWLAELHLPPGITLESNLIFIGDAYEIDPAEDIVQCLLRAWRDVGGLDLKVSGHNAVNDTSRLVIGGGIPAVSCAFDSQSGHADYEFVRLDRAERACRVALAAVWNFLHM